MFLLLALALASASAPASDAWNRIDFFCVVRDSQGRAIVNLTKERIAILDNGAPQPLVEFARASGPPAIQTVDGLTYRDAYLAIFRVLPDSKSDRRILLITGRDRDEITPAFRWELVLLALREHVMIYGTRGASAAVAMLAEETGGRIVDSRRDIDADLAAQYHIVAMPAPRGEKVGAFHSLTVSVPAGLHVQAPHNYYIVPPWDRSDEREP